MQLASSIFKAYDIRGIVPSTLTPQVAEALGQAFGTIARAQGERVVAVGRDGRLSGPLLGAALVRGLVAAGIDVIDIGMVTTPMLYFAASTLATSGIQVTGSHNPKDYNGFKMVLRGRAIHGDDIQALRRMMEDESWVLQPGGLSAAGPSQGAKAPDGLSPAAPSLPAQARTGRRAADSGGGLSSAAPALSAAADPGAVASVGAGSITNVNVLAPYRDRIVLDAKLARPMHIVVDCGNGVAGASAPAIFRALGCKVTELFSEVDGNFPNHHPDPSKPENLRDLIQALQTSDAELGLAFDGDGDRLGIVTKDGHNIYPDRQMILFARDVLARVPGGQIVFDVKCSQRLAPAIESFGGKALMYKTGHSLIKAKMREVGSPLGGEMSGHIFFKERWFGFDDGTYAGCRLLEIVSRSPDANAVLNALPTSFSTPELNVKCAEGEPPAVVARAVELARFAAPARISTIDGLRVDWPDGFGLMRSSNTTPVVVLRFEGHTPEALQRIEGEMLALLRQVKPDAKVGEAAH